MTTTESDDPRRRRVLGYVALSALAAAGVAGGWYATRPDGADSTAPQDPTATPSRGETDTDEDPADVVPTIVKRYAPDLYFGALEKWYPTDPRPYVTETDDGPVVEGIAALDEYSAAIGETETPPAPMVFYNVTPAADGVDAIQYWMYSVFDQFTVNFHWHDWELLQVFVDRESGAPLLLSASSHSRACPNNEFLAPEISVGRRPGILSEVGSHSSASEINDVIPSFERIPSERWHSDVTNDMVAVTADLVAPFAYGLPRDEGARLPFVMPELDGQRLDRHPSLSVDREDFIDERVTVDTWHDLPRPPADLPLREPGVVIAHSESPTEADATYELEPIDSLRDAIENFVGPQLSFEFAIPGFVEDQLAEHITSVGIPWKQDRFVDPLADVTDPAHRRQIDGDSPPGLKNRVTGRVRQLRSGADGALGRVPQDSREALEGAIDVSLYHLPVEVAVRLSSEEPTATATQDGIFRYLHVDAGEHLLVVNGPGFAPLAERFVHEGGLVRAGADGDLTVVASEDAGWIRGDGRETTGVDRVRVSEDYAGVIYDGQPVETDRFAVAVHRAGHYTVDVVDADGRAGAYRVGPEAFADDSEAVRNRIQTGKVTLADTLQAEIDDLYELARSLAESDRSREVLDRLSRAREAADEATTAAQRGDADAANEQLFRLVSLLQEVIELLAGEQQGGYGDAAVAILDRRVRAAIERARGAIETELA